MADISILVSVYAVYNLPVGRVRGRVGVTVKFTFRVRLRSVKPQSVQKLLSAIFSCWRFRVNI